MTLKTLTQAIKREKPAIIKERGVPRYVVLDWAMYEQLQESEDSLNGVGQLFNRGRMKEFSPTLIQKRALIRAEKNLLKGKTLSYHSKGSNCAVDRGSP